jgi:hypothetical protein
MFNDELQMFIDQFNAKRKLFDIKELILPNDLPEVRMMMEAEGSPENLSMDGKISVNAYEKRKNFWSKAMTQLSAYEQERG